MVMGLDRNRTKLREKLRSRDRVILRARIPRMANLHDVIQQLQAERGRIDAAIKALQSR